MNIDDLERMYPSAQEQAADLLSAVTSLGSSSDAVGDSATPSAVVQRRLGKAALIDGAPDVAQGASLKALEMNSEVSLSNSSSRFFDERMRTFQDEFRNIINSGTGLERPEEQVPAMVQQRADMHEVSQSAIAPSVAVVLKAAPNAEEELANQAILQEHINQFLINEGAKQGWADAVGNFFDTITPFIGTKDVADITTEINKSPDLAALHGAKLEDIVLNWQMQDSKSKVAAFPALLAAFVKAANPLVETRLEGMTVQKFLSNAIAGSPMHIAEAVDKLLAPEDGEDPKPAYARRRALGLLAKFFAPDAADELKAHQRESAAWGAVDVVSLLPVTKMARLMRGMGPAERIQVNSILRTASADAMESSLVHTVASAGDKASAAKLAVKAGTDAKAAAALGTTQENMALSAMPTESAIWQAGVAKELSPEMTKVLNADARVAEGYASAMTDETRLLRLGAIDEPTRISMREDFMAKLSDKAKSDYLQEGVLMENVKMVGETSDGFKYRYTLRSPAEMTNHVVDGEMKFTINNLDGTYELTVESLADNGTGIIGRSAATGLEASYLLAPKTWAIGGAERDFGREVARSMVSVENAAAFQAQADQMLSWALSPVRGIAGTGSRKRLEAVLRAGDEFIHPDTQALGKVYTPTELIAGVPARIGGKDTVVKLKSANEVTAYYRMRMLADANWHLENFMMRRELTLGGFKEALLADGSRQIVKPYETEAAARLSLQNKEGLAVFDDAARTTDIWTSESVAKRYQEGYRLARFRKRYNTGGSQLSKSGERVDYMWIKPQAVRELPQQVLHYKWGYAPKINRAEYMVVNRMPVAMKGVQSATVDNGMRGFASKMDAEYFRGKLVVEDLNNPKVVIQRNGQYNLNAITDPAEKERVMRDISKLEQQYVLQGSSDIGMAERLEEAVNASEGLYTGERAKERILFGLDGTDIDRVNVLEAFQRQVGHVGRMMGRNEVRIAQEKKWLNTVRKMMPDIRLEGFERTRLPATPEGKGLERIRQQISEWNGIPTHGESMFQAAIQQMHDWMLYADRKLPVGTIGLRGGEGSLASLEFLKHTRWATAVKSATMHSLLGTLNPRQMFVQASNAVTTASRMAGYNLTKADSVLAFKFHTLDNIRDMGALEGAVKAFVKDGWLSRDAADAYNAWRRTGYYESVAQNADLARVYTNGLGMTKDFYQKASNLSMFFYNAGEMYNRRYAFIKSFAKWRQGAGVGRMPGEEDMFRIMEDANKSMWEMNVANRATWQGGSGTSATRQIAGMMTQFMQAGTKPLEIAFRSEGLRGGLSNAEIRRILLGQLAFNGAVALPMGGYVVNAILRLTGAENVDITGNQQVDRALVETLNRGFNGFVVNTLLGANVDTSSPLSIGSQLTTTVKDMFKSGNPLVWAWMGPSGAATGIRTVDMIKELSILYTGSRDTGQPMDITTFRQAFPIVMQLSSAFNNGAKSWMMHNAHKLMNRYGKIVESKDFTLAEEIGVGLGFSNLTEMQMYTINEAKQERIDYIREQVKMRKKLIYDALYLHNLDPEQMATTNQIFRMYDEWADDPLVAEEIERQLEDAVLNPKDAIDEALKYYMDNTLPERLGEAAILDMGSEVGIVQPMQLAE